MALGGLLLLSLFVSLSSALPSLSVTPCPNPPPAPSLDWSKLHLTEISGFTLADAHNNATQHTTVHLCSTSTDLYVKFDCQDNNIYSPYTQCNEPLFKSDVVELFLAPPGNSTPHEYLELEARVTNPHLTCGDGMEDHMIACEDTGIKYEAKTDPSASSWFAYLRIPWKLIDQSIDEFSNQEIRANFFRIDTPLHEEKEYSCWSPTFTAPPCFHKPVYFGILTFST